MIDQERNSFLLAGGLLAVGAAVFAVGVVLYAILPSALSLPASQSSYQSALEEAVAMSRT